MPDKIDTRTARAELEPRPKSPYMHPIRRGVSLAYRKMHRAADDTWSVRYWLDEEYQWHKLGHVRLHTSRDVRDGFEFDEALTAANEFMAQIDGGVRLKSDTTGRAVSVADAC